MPEEKKPKTRDEVMLSITMQADHIESKMLSFSTLFQEFDMEWLLSVEANYKQFLDYCDCCIKQHVKNRKSP